MPAHDLAAVAVDIFGPDRVAVATRLDEALETAVTAAGADGDPAGAGVLVVGSVVLAGAARTLLKGRR
jgi:dihydrofolate synthase/folylpolyglutamate synthase